MTESTMKQAPLQLDTIEDVTARERNTDSLQSLPGRFWSDADETATVLKDRANSESDSAEAQEAYETALDLFERLAAQRKAKIVNMASLAASDLPVETDAMTTTEQDLFEEITTIFDSESLAPQPDADGNTSTGETAPVEVND